MNQIFKYELVMGDVEQTIMLPFRAKILCVQMQRNVPCIWVLVADVWKDKMEERKFLTVGTGQEFNVSDKRYIGTYQTHGGSGIWHVFVQMTAMEQLLQMSVN